MIYSFVGGSFYQNAIDNQQYIIKFMIEIWIKKNSKN